MRRQLQAVPTMSEPESNAPPIQEEITQEVPTSDPWFEAREIALPILRSEQPFPALSANLKFELGQIDEDTWREEIYKWLQTLKRLFLPSLRRRMTKVHRYYETECNRVQQVNADLVKLHNIVSKTSAQIMLLEKGRDEIEPQLKDKIHKLEETLIEYFRKDLHEGSSDHNPNPFQSDTNRGTPLQHEQQVTLEPSSSPVSSPQLLQLPSSQNALPRKKQSITSSDKNSANCNPQESAIHRLLRAVNSMSPATVKETLEASITPSPFGGTSDFIIPETKPATTFPQQLESNQGKDSLTKEITTINQRLMNTKLEICDENDTSTPATSFKKDGKGKIIKCIYINYATMHYPVSSENTLENQWPIQPLKLKIPENYPQESPLMLDNSSTLASDMKNEEDLTEKAISRLKLHLLRIEQPWTLTMIAKAWDICTHDICREFAEQHGGGCFSSKYGVWEKVTDS